MKRWAGRAAWMLLGAALFGASFATAQGPDTLYRKRELLAEVLGQIERHYVDAVSPTDLVYGAALGATRALDAHSAFFTPERVPRAHQPDRGRIRRHWRGARRAG